jgi:prepilin-type N-terminal cleavage/methylation domain-containing protein
MGTKQVKTRGFTIVELLTVMAVIAVLIGLLIPALALVKDNAKKIQQRAQFHSIDVGIELFKSDFGVYPESNDNSVGTYSSPQDTYDPTTYGGANKLAEAMVGQDFMGFHPSSAFNASGEALVASFADPSVTIDVEVYSANANQANWQTADANIKSRKGPYMDLENANAFPMDQVYGLNNTNFSGPFDMGTKYKPLVLCDVFAKKRSGIGAKKTGTPILYFRARTNYVHQDYSSALSAAPNPGGIEDDIYYMPDNLNLLNLGMPDDGVDFTLMLGTPEANFDNMIVNEQVQTIKRPYRADTYILISAGKDGDFGTADDIFNFEKEIIE